MKLLLTSAGVRNQTIADALTKLVGKTPADTKIGFITTARNVEYGGGRWYLDQFKNLERFGYVWIDVVDPSADDAPWQAALQEVDVVLVGGGNTFHLLNQARRTGLDAWLIQAVKTQVYLGISAGSILATPSIAIADVGNGADINLCGITDLTGLNLVDFELSPHSPEEVTPEENAGYAATISNKLIAYDDETAVQVIDGGMTIVTEGSFVTYNA